MRQYRFHLMCAVIMILITTAPRSAVSLSPAQEPTQETLQARFKNILAEKFKAKNASATPEAEKELEKLTAKAAERIVEKQAGADLDKADRNFKDFADKLIKRAKQPLIDEIEITPKVVDEVLNGRINPHGSDPTERKGGVCPVFPIC